MSCDIRLASETAVFGQPEVGLGITPGFGGTQRMARLIGMGKAKELIYSARNIKAPEALAVGLVQAVYPADQLMAEAEKLASRIAGNAPIAVRACKKAVNEGTQVDLDRALSIEEKLFGSCFETKDQKSAMDGILAMQGEGPTAGSPYQANKILISEDPLALDAVAAKMLGMDVEDIPILETARKRDLGEGFLNNIILAGDYGQVPRLGSFKLPKRFRGAKKRNSKVLVKVINFFDSHPRINPNKCKKCNMCVDSCPVQAIDKETRLIDYDACIGCMCCHELCMPRKKNTDQTLD